MEKLRTQIKEAKEKNEQLKADLEKAEEDFKQAKADAKYVMRCKSRYFALTSQFTHVLQETSHRP